MTSEMLKVLSKRTISNQLPRFHAQLHLATFVLLVALALPSFAAVPYTPQVAPLATSTVPSNDDRVGALWEAIDPNDPTNIVKKCSANHLGNGFWITAHHCIASNPSMQGFIKQDDGDQAPIKEIFTKSNNDDVALIKVEEGIQAQSFILPSRAPYVGEEFSLIGFAKYKQLCIYSTGSGSRGNL